MDGSLNLCQVSTGQEQDWKDLYNSSFPADERTPLEELQRLLDAGSILLHRTTNKTGELLCFSIVYPMSNFALLSYIASDATKRSSGIGSKHMKRLLEILKSKYPEFLGLVLEIESTRQQGLEAADKTARQRRLAFYQRLGAKRLCRTYVWPSYSLKGTYRLAELMWFDFDPSTIDDPHLPGIITELYTKGYGAQSDDPILELVVHQFKCSEKIGSAAVVCPVEQGDKKPAEGDKKTAETKDAPAKADDSLRQRSRQKLSSLIILLLLRQRLLLLCLALTKSQRTVNRLLLRLRNRRRRSPRRLRLQRRSPKRLVRIKKSRLLPSTFKVGKAARRLRTVPDGSTPAQTEWR